MQRPEAYVGFVEAAGHRNIVRSETVGPAHPKGRKTSERRANTTAFAGGAQSRMAGDRAARAFSVLALTPATFV